MDRAFYAKSDSQIIRYQQLMPYPFYALRIPKGMPQDYEFFLLQSLLSPFTKVL